MKRLFLITWIVTLIVIAFGFSDLRFSINAEIFTSNLMIEGNLTSQVQPSITIDDFGNIYVVWRDYRNDLSLPSNARGDIYFAKSTNGGISFSIAQKVSDDLGDAQQNIPSIAVDSSGVIHVVWEDWRNDADGRWVGSDGGIDGLSNGDIYYANSSDGGTTWSKSKMINDDGGTTQQGRPDIAIDSNDIIHVVWEDRRRVDDFDIYYANSTDGGITFSINKKINDLSTESRDPAIAIDEKDNIHIAWCDYRNTGITGPDIYYTNSTDGGINFSSNKRVSDDTGNAYQFWPDIAANGDIIGIVWEDERETSVYFANSTDGGITFSPNKRVNDVIGAANWDAAIAINSDGYICVVWEGKDNDIYFVNSTDGGATFSPSQRVNDDTGTDYQRLPSLILKNRTVYVLWQDDRNGNYDIYFSRSNYPPPMATPISPPNDSNLLYNTTTLEVTPISDLDNDTIYYNFTISNQSDAESGTVYYSDWITSTSWNPPPLPDGKWFWHTYTSDMWNTTAPNWVWNFTVNTTNSSVILLYEGWNLISLPRIQLDPDIETVLQSIEDQYDSVWGYNITDINDPWRHYHSSKPPYMNDLWELNHSMGFWVHITEPEGTTLVVFGDELTSNQSIPLYAGWNLVGYPSTMNRTRDEALNNLEYDMDIYKICHYNTTAFQMEMVTGSDSFEVGQGYWIYANNLCVWEVPL